MHALVVFGQDWYPWKPDTEYYYSAGEGEQFWIIRQDSIASEDYLINSKLVSPFPGGCEDSSFATEPMLHSYKFNFSGDTTIIDGEGMIFALNHRANVGDYWSFNGIGFSLEYLDTEVVFEEEDSVAVFLIHDDGYESLIDGDSIVLSKSYGIIQMPSFNNYILQEFMDYDLELMSIRSESFEAGPRLPLFEDVMPLSPGDLLLFKNTIYNQPYGFGADTYYGRYYLARNVLDEDHITLTYSLVRYAEGEPDYIGTITDTLERHFWEQIMYQDDRRYNIEPGMYDTDPGGNPSPMIQVVDDVTYQIVLNDVIMFSWRMDRSASMRYLDTISCWSSPLLTDYNTGYSYYSTLTGRYYISKYSTTYYGNVPAVESLIGYSIGGLEWGELTVPTTLPEYIGDPIQISPNPATNKIYCLVNDLEQAEYSIINSAGSLVAKGVWYKDQAIELEGFRPGIYILKLMHDQTLFHTVFVKR